MLLQLQRIATELATLLGHKLGPWHQPNDTGRPYAEARCRRCTRPAMVSPDRWRGHVIAGPIIGNACRVPGWEPPNENNNVAR